MKGHLLPFFVGKGQNENIFSSSLTLRTCCYQAEHHSEMTRREGLHSAEVKKVKAELRDSESQCMSVQREVMILKDKVEKVRRER